MAEHKQSPFVAASHAAAVTRIIEARRRRTRLFSADLFADPAWDIMLELFLADLEGRITAISELGYKTEVPLTTSLRWIDKLQADGWAKRTPDPLDHRRVFVELSPAGNDVMRVWLEDWLEQNRPAS
jgi:DNA-binding MarR family transcriptional regulator